MKSGSIKNKKHLIYPKKSHLPTNFKYILLFYMMFVLLFILIYLMGLSNLNMYLSIVATVLGILSISLTIYFYKETNKLYIEMNGLINEIQTHTRHISDKQSEWIGKIIDKATDTVPKEKFVEEGINIEWQR